MRSTSEGQLVEFRVVYCISMLHAQISILAFHFCFSLGFSNGMPDRAQQRAFIADMTQQMLGELQNEALARALGSVHQFAAAFGLFQPEAGARGAPTVEFRIKVLVCAHSRSPQFQSNYRNSRRSPSTAPPHLF